MQKQEELKVLFLPINCAGTAWYRMVQYANIMNGFDDMSVTYPKFDPENNGYSDYEWNFHQHAEDIQYLFSISDIIVIQTARSLEFSCVVKACKEMFPEKPLLMECDDHPFAMDASHPNFRYIGDSTHAERAAFDQASDSDAIICSTKYLKDVFRDQNEFVYIVPNAIDPKAWPKAEPVYKNKVRIGYSAASAHDKDMKLIHKALEIVLNKYDFVDVHFIHHPDEKFIDHPRFSVGKTWVGVDKYPKHLDDQGYDIGIAPLRDSEFKRAKSNLRFLEYGTLKIPCVASNVESYKYDIIDGHNGFLAASTQEWVDKLSLLCEKESLRKKIGDNAYNYVRERYDAVKIAREYADLLKRIESNYRINGRPADVNVLGIAK